MNLKTKEIDPIAREGYPFILGGIFSSFIFYRVNRKDFSLAAGLFSLLTLYFFRNPVRKSPAVNNAIISAADGRVVFIGNAFERYFFRKEVKRVSVFMSLSDVHVNRSPVDGVVIGKVYNKGRYFAAYKDKASLDNEQSAILVETPSGMRIVVVQIAGFVARRIATYPNVGEYLKRGAIFGLIRFGSRVDIYVENGFEEMVTLGDRVKAGETVLGIFK